MILTNTTPTPLFHGVDRSSRSESVIDIYRYWVVKNNSIWDIFNKDIKTLRYPNGRNISIPNIKYYVSTNGYTIGDNKPDPLALLAGISHVLYFRAPENISEFLFLRMMGIFIYPEKVMPMLGTSGLEIDKISQADSSCYKDNPLIHLTNKDLTDTYYLKVFNLAYWGLLSPRGHVLSNTKPTWMKLERGTMVVPEMLKELLHENNAAF